MRAGDALIVIAVTIVESGGTLDRDRSGLWSPPMDRTPPIFDPKATTLTVLRYLVALDDHRHFGHAAAACLVAQPTLSEQVTKWEKRMEIKVFERTPELVPTAIGQRVIAEARRVLAGLERLEAIAGPGQPPFFGPVRLGVIQSLGPYLLPVAGPAIERQFPTLAWPVREGLTEGLLADLVARDLDVLALAVVPGLPSDLVVARIATERFQVALPAAHPLAAEATLTPDDLLGESLLLLDDGHCLRDQVVEVCGRRPSHQAGADYRAASLETLRQLVLLGRGITLLPALAAQAAEGDARLALRPLSEGHRTLALVWRRGDHREAGFQRLAEVLRVAVAKAGLAPLS